jgi:transposase-like protein
MTQTEKRKFWLEILEQQKQSALSIPDFCQQHNINYQTFHYWVKKFESQDSPQRALPIVVEESASLVVLSFANGLRAELPSALSSTQIKTWI